MRFHIDIEVVNQPFYLMMVIIFLKGGEQLSEDEVRRRQAEKYRREKFTRFVRKFCVIFGFRILF